MNRTVNPDAYDEGAEKVNELALTTLHPKNKNSRPKQIELLLHTQRPSMHDVVGLWTPDSMMVVADVKERGPRLRPLDSFSTNRISHNDENPEAVKGGENTEAAALIESLKGYFASSVVF